MIHAIMSGGGSSMAAEQELDCRFNSSIPYFFPLFSLDS